MNKNEIYTWRLSSELKAVLEEAARDEGTSLAEILDRAVTQWLTEHGGRNSDEQTQQRLHAAASATFGKIHGGDPLRSTTVRQQIRAKMQQKRASR
jgi:hypothetical protein